MVNRDNETLPVPRRRRDDCLEDARDVAEELEVPVTREDQEQLHRRAIPLRHDDLLDGFPDNAGEVGSHAPFIGQSAVRFPGVDCVPRVILVLEPPHLRVLGQFCVDFRPGLIKNVEFQ
jgi:hypothetical protein